MLKGYTYKVIISGDITEVYAYSQTQYKKIKVDDIENEKHIKEIKKEFEKSEETEEIIKLTRIDEKDYKRNIENINRTRMSLKRLINANVGQYKEYDKFYTLTFKKYVNREELCKQFMLFKKRMYRKYGKFEYIAVIERGTKGTKRLHIHMVCFGIKFIPQKQLAAIWGQGFVDIRAIDEEIDNVADYMCKYVDKTLASSYIGKGQRFYFPSQNLKKPEVFEIKDEDLEDFAEDIGSEVFSFEFDSEHVGRCVYSKYRKVQYE